MRKAIAAMNGHKDVVEILLSKEVDVNAVDQNGNTPLHLAVEHEEVVKALLDKGANVDVKNKDENTPLLLAAKEEIKTLLKNAEDTDLTTEGVGSFASAQTEEQPSSFFGNLFSILTKPFSLIASFFSGFFSWLFGSNVENADEYNSQSDVSLLTSNSLDDDSYDRMNTDS